MRYRGRLYGDSCESYERLAKDLGPKNLTPLFRMAGEEHEIQLMPAPEQPRSSNPMVNLVMFVLTIFTMLIAGALFAFEGPIPRSVLGFVRLLPSGIPFAASLMAILLAHEFGHYLAGSLP